MLDSSTLSPWTIRDRNFDWGTRTYLMGILNVTPDSFSDGGEFDSVARAVAQAQRLAAAGMDILDVGGQSTRPQAEQIDLETELARVVPVIAGIRQVLETPISIDTTRAAVAEAAIAAGADIVNDVSGGTYDAQMLGTVARLQVPIILMHLRGNPKTMQQLTDYDDLLGDIIAALEQQIAIALQAGIPRDQIAVDPGIGFAKTGPQNLEILRDLARLRPLNCPILVGPSRKSFIGTLLQQPDPQQRAWGTAATCCAAIAHGADLLRIHDGPEMADVACIADAIWRSSH